MYGSVGELETNGGWGTGKSGRVGWLQVMEFAKVLCSLKEKELFIKESVIRKPLSCNSISNTPSSYSIIVLHRILLSYFVLFYYSISYYFIIIFYIILL